MKINLKSTICIITFILISFVGNVRADEVVRCNIDELSSAGSIIRHYKDNMDVACYHSTSDPIFMIYKEGSPTTYVLYLDYMDTIYDFEIYHDTIYFCGNSYYHRVGTSVVGYFAVSSLLSTSPANVAYISLPAMETIRAIEVAWFASRKHVVGVGKAINSNGMMVDLIDEGSFWKVNTSDVGGDTIILSDLAITDNYVVVTSSQQISYFFSSGHLWYFDKPTSVAQSLFPSSPTLVSLNDYVGSKYLIKYIVGDCFATVHSVRLGHYVLPLFVMSYFIGLSHYKSFSIHEESENVVRLGDISLTEASKIINLLLYGSLKNNDEFFLGSVIYEIPNILISSVIPSTLTAHVYDGIFFESLDHKWVNNIDDQHFVSSGNMPNGYGTPNYLTYHSLYFGGKCLDKKENIPTELFFETNTQRVSVTNTLSQQVPEIYIHYPKEMIVDTKCFSITHSPVYENQ
jgi:hypothetical protein